jgi:hypothetical protein
MFARNRMLTAAAVMSTLAIAAPVASANAAQMPPGRATVGASPGSHRYGNPMNRGRGNPRNHGRPRPTKPGRHGRWSM